MRDIRKPYQHSSSSARMGGDIAPRHEAPQRLRALDERIDHAEIRETFSERKPRFQDRSDVALFPHEEKDSTVSRIRRRKKVPWLAILIVSFVGTGAYLLTFVFNSASLMYTPKYADVIPVTKVAIGGEDGVSVAFATVERAAERELEKSGTTRVVAKAAGEVTLKNSFDDKPQRLIKNTRLETADGKIFRTADSVTVPGMKNGTPGIVKVKAVADQPGSDYNIKEGNFTIPGFKNQPQYSGFSASVASPFSGGANGDVALVSQSDLNAAKDELALELRKSASAEVKDIKREGYLGMYENTHYEITDNEVDVRNGTTAVYKAKLVATVPFVDGEGVARALVKDQSSYQGEKVRLDQLSVITFTLPPEAAISLATSTLVLVEGKARVVWVTDQMKLKQTLLAKKESELSDVIKGFPSISKATPSITPFWNSNFPDRLSSITIVESLPPFGK